MVQPCKPGSPLSLTPSPLRSLNFTPLTVDVLVAVVVTDCCTGDDVLLLKLLSPWYVAEMLWTPTDNVDVVKVAWSLPVTPLSVPVPKTMPLSINVTFPQGVPEPGEFAAPVAVN